jgi:predicted GIY-YIG superfamily endonuclease
MSSQPDPLVSFSDVIRFADVSWSTVPDAPGVYVIYDHAEVLYVGMAGRDGAGSLRKRLKDHSSGQVVNMFAQYLFLSRVQFVAAERVTHPRDAKVACRAYIWSAAPCGTESCRTPSKRALWRTHSSAS